LTCQDFSHIVLTDSASFCVTSPKGDNNRVNRQPELILTDKALQYLKRKGSDSLTLELKPLMSCCVPYSPPPHISFKKPDHPARFIALSQNGINIYLDPTLYDIDRLTIDKHGFSIFSWLSVVDWRPLPP
jgi:hypothetical protein